MKSVRDWLNEYSLSHQNPVNKTVHWICVPVITLTVLGLLRAIPVGNDVINACTIGSALALAYYAALSWRLALGMVGAFVLLYSLVQASYYALGAAMHVGAMIAIFVAAWIGQFIGHNVEGARPSFFKDLQFLLIGPLWLMSFVYGRLDLAIDDRRVAHG
jgi:uncharacterized membrane protein YGL010W